MGLSWIRVILIPIFSVSFIVHVRGELIMIRHPKENVSGNIVQDFTCITEADGTALVWNDELGESDDATQFGETCITSGNCLTYPGIISHDDLTGQRLCPRHVSQLQYFTEERGSQLYLNDSNGMDPMVFSVRGSGYIHVRLDVTMAPKNRSCFRITIANFEVPVSKILPCHDELSGASNMRSRTPDRLSHVALEWRTYGIRFHTSGTIEVFTNKKKILTDDLGEGSKVKYTMIENPDKQRLRRHSNSHCWRHIANDDLVLKPINCDGHNLYARLTAGFCSTCQLNVKVVVGNEETLGSRIVNKDPSIPKDTPLFWQLHRLNISVGEKHCDNTTRVIISPLKDEGGDNIYWWAFHSFVTYEPEGPTRQMTRRFNASNNVKRSACQKLSYNENESSIVYSDGKIRDINLSNVQYSQGKWTLFNSQFRYPGNGTSVCNQEGCTCAPGFTGNNCNKGCPEGYYGYNCRASCSSCKGRTCDTINGECKYRCRNYYLPPDCTIKLGPRYLLCNKSGLLFDCPKELNDYQKRNLDFEIKEAKHGWMSNFTIFGACNPSQRQLEVIRTLERRMKYSVRAVINGNRFAETHFNTDCWEHAEPHKLSVVSQNHRPIILKWKYKPHSWEKPRIFRLYIVSLDSKLEEISTKKSWESDSILVLEKETMQMDLPLLNVTNYMFSIWTADSGHHSKFSEPASVLYLVPDSLKFGAVERMQYSDRITNISFALPYKDHLVRDRATGKSTLEVIVAGSSVCPPLEQTQNITRSENLKTREFPVCALHFNKTYSFTIDIEVEESGKSQLIWLLVLPVFAACGVLGYRSSRKYIFIPLKLRSHSVPFVNDGGLGPIFEQENLPSDSYLPPEVRKFRSFENYVKKAAENGLLRSQFLMLPRGLIRSHECGRLPMNRRKNGYEDSIAYDETRVLLVRDSNGIINSDYINANYVHGYAKEKAYIATQAPLPHTIVDFWRMVWQEEVRIICMLVDTANMCEQYWPEVGKKISYGGVVITTTNQRVFAEYTYRTFHLTTIHGRESQLIEHLQYTNWPEEGAPLYSHSVVEYLQKLLSVAPGQGPIVVHCNSGTGRTGTIILADIAMRHLAAEGTVDVFSEARRMYSARANMLNDFTQYVLAHLVPIQCLLMIDTKVRCSDITQEKINEMKAEVPKHLARIEEFSWMDKALRPLEPIRPRNPKNVAKNRFPELAPVGPYLVSFKRNPKNESHSDYISAVSVDGVKMREQYIASQLPMPSTHADFWRLFLEKNIELIIILQVPDPTDPTCCVIIPRESPVIPLPYLKVETQSSSIRGEYYTIDELLLTDMSLKPSRMRTITALTCHNWSSGEERPPAPERLVELWRASERFQRDGPTLVLCYNGVLGCGLYIALGFMLERMAVEHECDVVLSVQAVRRSRVEFISSQWQLKYLYDAAVKYAESFQDYGNFTGVGGLNQWYYG